MMESRATQKRVFDMRKPLDKELTIETLRVDGLNILVFKNRTPDASGHSPIIG